MANNPLQMLDNIVGLEQPIRKYIKGSKFSQVNVICGNKLGGKKTLIHFLLGKGLEPDVSEDGQEILNILEEA